MSEEEKKYLYNLGQNVDELYRKKYVSQNEFAKVVDCDNRTIRRIVRGEQNISILLLKRIAECLDVEVNALLKNRRVDDLIHN